MSSAFQKADSQCDVFNLGGTTTTNITGVAQIIVEEMGLNDVRFKYTGGQRGWPGDIPVTGFDVKKIKRPGGSTA